MTPSKSVLAPLHPIPFTTDNTTLIGKLQSLTVDERREIEQMIMQLGEARALAHWDLILAQIDYILSL